MAKKDGIGPKGTALSGDWESGESHEIQDQGGYSIGNNRNFLNGPGSKNNHSETTFSGNHSGIVKAGMDAGLYKAPGVDSGFNKPGAEGAPFHVIEAKNTAVETLQSSRDKENELRDEGYEAAGESVKSIADETGLTEKDDEESLGGNTEIYSGEDLEKVGSKDYSNFGQDTVDEAMDVDTDLVSMGKKKKKGIDLASLLTEL